MCNIADVTPYLVLFKRRMAMVPVQAAEDKTKEVLDAGELGEDQHFMALGFESEGHVPEEAKNEAAPRLGQAAQGGERPNQRKAGHIPKPGWRATPIGLRWLRPWRTCKHVVCRVVSERNLEAQLWREAVAVWRQPYSASSCCPSRE